MGIARKQDRATPGIIIENMSAPAAEKHTGFVVEPQIAPGMRLSGLEKCTNHAPRLEHFAFYFLLGPRITLHKVFKLIEGVTETWEQIWRNLNQDALGMFGANGGKADEMSLAVRPIEFWASKK